MDELGREITEPSNAVVPDDAEAPLTLLTGLQGYWDGDDALDQTYSQWLVDEEYPAYNGTGGPGGGPSCSLGELDFVTSDDDAWFNFAGEQTTNVWVSHNEDQGLGFISARTVDGYTASYALFVAMDAQVGSVAHFQSASVGEGTPYDWETEFGVYPPDWYMLTMIQTPTELRWYLNGQLRAGLTKAFATVRLPGVAFRVKDNHPWGTWTGAWANLGLWHRELDAAEVTALYNEGVGRTYGELLL